MESLLKLEPIDKDLHWNKLVNHDSIYIEEFNDQNSRTGRGFYLWTNLGLYHIGYWKQELQNGFGRFYTKDNFLTYEGDYVGGVRHGNGTHFYGKENKYVGQFVKGVRHGKGTYYWDKDSYWVGTFENDKFNGEGIYYYQGNSMKMDYDNGTVKK